jgi:accessory gene regulator protein AgrB
VGIVIVSLLPIAFKVLQERARNKK